MLEEGRTATMLREYYRPRHWEPGIVHGDYQFANVMFAHGTPARLAAIVDWEMSTVGDPVLDLGWVLNSLARFKLAIVLEGGYARVVAGTADNPKMEAFGAVVLDNVRAAAELASSSRLPATAL
jgi:Phosphotransferase enzyme family